MGKSFGGAFTGYQRCVRNDIRFALTDGVFKRYTWNVIVLILKVEMEEVNAKHVLVRFFCAGYRDCLGKHL